MKLFDLFATLTLDSGGFDKGLTKTQKNIQNVAASIRAIGTNIQSNIQSTIQTVVKVGAAVTAAGTAAAGYILKTGIGYNQQMDDYTANMQTLLGGVDKAEAKIKELSDMAAKTPFELPTLADATQTLLSFGVKAEDSTGILKSLGDISLGNASKLETLVRAYGKMSSTGKVTLENIQMMIDAGFNPLNLVAERYGMTMDNLYKALSDGKVPFDELTWAIAKATGEGGQFFNGMETASKTLTGRLSTLKENWSAFLALLTKPAYETLRDTVLPSAIDMVDKLTAAFSENGIQGVLSTVESEISKISGNIVSKVTEYFDSDQAKTDLQNATGKIAKLLTGGNIVLSDVTSFITNILSKINDTFADDTVKANLASTGEKLIKGFMTFQDGKIKTIISGLSIIGDIALALLQGVSDYFNSENGQAASDFASILGAIADGIGKAAISLPKLITVATNIITGIADAISDSSSQEKITQIVAAIGDALAALGESAMENLPNLIIAGVKIAAALVDAIVKGLPEALQKLWDALFSADPTEQEQVQEFGKKLLEAFGLEFNWKESGIYKAYSWIKEQVEAIPESIETLKEKITEFWNTVTNWDSGPIHDAWTWVSDKITAIPEAIETLKENITEFFGDFKVAYESSPVYTAVNAVKDAINSVISAAKSAIDWLKQLFGLQNSGGGNSQMYDSPIGPPKAPTWDDARGFATGLYSVPYDNFPALLHRNETVLTRAKADEYRKGGGGSAESKQDIYNINIQSTAESPSETAAYIKQAMRTLRFNQA